MRFFAQVDFDFVKLRRGAFAVSVGLFLVGLASFVGRGGLRMSIDFEGGNLVQVRFQFRVMDGLNDCQYQAGVCLQDLFGFFWGCHSFIRTVTVRMRIPC